MPTVLVPIDFSPVTTHVTNAAVAIGKAMGATLTLLHVLPRNFELEEAGRRAEAQPVRLRYPKDWKAIQKLTEQVRSEGCSVNPELAEGHTVRTILDKAEDLNVDLIVIGSHGHSSLYDLLVGSVSEGVLRRSRWPVLVVPSPDIQKHRHQTNTVESHEKMY